MALTPAPGLRERDACRLVLPPRVRFEVLLDLLQCRSEIYSDRLVGEADNREPCRDDRRLARCILSGPAVVSRSIQLDDQAALHAAEVDDEATDGMLAPELRPRQAPITEVLPEHTFSFGLIMAQLPGADLS